MPLHHDVTCLLEGISANNNSENRIVKLTNIFFEVNGNIFSRRSKCIIFIFSSLLNEGSTVKADVCMTCDFTPFSTVFQSFQNDDW